MRGLLYRFRNSIQHLFFAYAMLPYNHCRELSACLKTQLFLIKARQFQMHSLQSEACSAIEHDPVCLIELVLFHFLQFLPIRFERDLISTVGKCLIAGNTEISIRLQN